MGDQDYFKPGAWNQFCQRCGSKRKELRREWTGLYVCEFCFEQRNAQELLRPIADPKPPPFTAPRPPVRLASYQQASDKFVVDGANFDDVMIG